MRHTPTITASTAAFIIICSSAYADPVTLARGSTVLFDYNSAVFGETVARTSLSLDTAGSQLSIRVEVLPQNTFLQEVYFEVDPAVPLSLIQFIGYRDVSIIPSAEGFTFGVQFGGDPGLRGGGPFATVTASLVGPAPLEGLVVGSTAAFVYGFRGNQVLQDTAPGAPVPEPGTLLLVTTGLIAARCARRKPGPAGSRAFASVALLGPVPAACSQRLPRPDRPT